MKDNMISPNMLRKSNLSYNYMGTPKQQASLIYQNFLENK